MLTDIVNHLWQSTLIAAAIAALVATLRDHGAHVRYWLWLAASVKFLIPFSLLASLGSTLFRADTPLVDLAELPVALSVIAEPMPEAAAWTPLALALLGVWLLGFAGVICKWVASALKVRALLQTAVPFAGVLPLPAVGPAARTSAALIEPALVGVFRPVLLLPNGIDEHLTRAQLDAVVAHELTHWRRHDNLTAGLHMLVEAVLWFHPLVWWIGARLIEERERACDEAVVREGHEGRAYAEAILNVCERYVASRLECAAGVSGADLKRRVLEIARNKVMSVLPIEKKLLLGTLALATVLVPVVFGAVSGRIEAQSTPSDRDLRPLVRINPEYPPAALAAKLEGEVNLEFTITATGTVRDIVVVDSTSAEFEQPAITALSRWRYQPPPADRLGVRTMIRFQLAAGGPPP
jgi:bla regulator protein blaR1